ncbi:MAG: PAS domain S-box protein [Acetobacteraceae bacterium]|nr:PAS domain S-box protein [Acetobacteraceae bacterium]
MTVAPCAEAALAESETRLRLATVGVGVAHVGLDGRWLLASTRLCEMLGYTEAELRLRTFQDLTYPDDLGTDLDQVHRLLAGEIQTYSMEKRYIRREGTLLWIELTVSLVRGEDGAPRHFIAVVQDIQTRKAAESTLVENERRLRDLLTTLDLGASMARDMDGTIRHWSKGCERLYGWTAAEAVGCVSHDLLRTVFPVPLAEIESALERCGEWTGELQHTTRNGREVIAAVRKVLRRDDAGRPAAVMESLADVTAQRKAEAKLLALNEGLEAQVREEVAARVAAQARLAHAQRMEALGQLAGGIAHDFNNVLQAVTGGADLIVQCASDAKQVAHWARRISASAERGAAITGRLLAFARRGNLRTETIDPALLLESMREILAHTLGDAIEVRAQAAPNLPVLLADRGQLETVLVNLATNARDAMPSGGLLVFSAGLDRWPHGDGNEGTVRWPAHPSSKRYLRLSVTDTGKGMTPDILARVTEPFFTTKPRGKGTGLGLAMAKGFAEQSDGALKIESAPGQGTTVTLWFPIVPEEPSLSPDGRDGSPSSDAPRRRILLVDDDAIVHEVLVRQLEREGFDVLAANSGAEALAILDAGETVDVLVSDLSMPGMDGLALIHEARQRRQKLQAILLTGIAAGAAELASARPISGNFSLLRKPATSKEIAERINAM